MSARDSVRIGGAVCFAFLVAAGGCHSQGPDGGAKTRPSAEEQRTEVVTGTIRHVDLAGGFYGIETDDGRKLDPVNLPAALQKDGLRIEARVEELRDRVSIRMWGTLVRIIEFKRL